MANPRRYSIPIEKCAQDKIIYSQLKTDKSYTIETEFMPNGTVSVEVYTQVPTVCGETRELSSTVVDGTAITYFDNGSPVAEMKAVIEKGIDQIYRKYSYPQPIKDALMLLEEKLAV